MKTLIGTCLALGLLYGCGGPSAPETVRMKVAAAPAERPVVDEGAMISPLKISSEAVDKIDDIKEILDANSLSRLARLAGSEPAFVSNFSGTAHRTHWDLLRRTGFDPLAQLQTLLDGPFAEKNVGDEVWYIWPDLAALDADDLLPEKLSFSDRARLADLVGEVGIERIRSGADYPGVRTAIAEDGRWLYFVDRTEPQD